MKITGLRVTPVAVPDPPLRNSWGVHAPYMLRNIIEMDTDEGITGISEAPGGAAFLSELQVAGKAIEGEDPFHLERLRVKLRERARAFAAIEVACWDAIGKKLSMPVYDLLGGKVRERAQFASYLFYKYGGDNDRWGEVNDPQSMARLARQFREQYGFTTIKVKGGVLPPDEEIETIRLLRKEFPTDRLRLDPNAVWSVETSIRVCKALEAYDIEYMEDPTWGIYGMAAVARHTSIPLSTNMCVTTFDDFGPAVETKAVQVILCDHHYWEGLSGCKRLAAVCESFHLGLSMHSNNHLGISMAAMAHLAVCTPLLIYACDTHYPWQAEDVIKGGKLRFVNGTMTPPNGPGLGVEIDHERLGTLNEAYKRGAGTARDDTAEMQKRDPYYLPLRPRW